MKGREIGEDMDKNMTIKKKIIIRILPVIFIVSIIGAISLSYLVKFEIKQNVFDAKHNTRKVK